MYLGWGKPYLSCWIHFETGKTRNDQSFIGFIKLDSHEINLLKET